MSFIFLKILLFKVFFSFFLLYFFFLLLSSFLLYVAFFFIIVIFVTSIDIYPYIFYFGVCNAGLTLSSANVKTAPKRVGHEGRGRGCGAPRGGGVQCPRHVADRCYLLCLLLGFVGGWWIFGWFGGFSFVILVFFFFPFLPLSVYVGNL